MMRMILLAALVALAGCDNTSSVVREIERAERERAEAAQNAAALSDSFLARVRAQPGVVARPSGLLIEVRERGANQRLARPSRAATVLVHYEGKLPDGSVFDSSIARGEPVEFPLSDVVAGFSEAIQQMRPGDEIIATFPGDLGYGPEGRPPMIPPNAALQFRIILLAFREPNGSVVSAPG